MMILADAHERQQALDISRSFIVQAPAGSGKTGVLTQRILKLLTVVERPEQILAITFTKKAAAEMRNRVLEALQLAASGNPPQHEYELEFYRLAQQVLQRDQLKQWGLTDNLNRLRLQTIDSLCSSIVKDSPLVSGLGVQFGIEDDASDLYGEAARNLLASLDEDSAVGAALMRVLSYLDNQYRKLNDLICQMLLQRDHWLRDVVNIHENWDSFRQLLQQSLANVNAEAERRLDNLLSPLQRSEVEQLASYACNQLHLAGTAHPLTLASPDSLQYRKARIALFLTSDGKIRTAVDKRCGFPAPSDFKNKEEKAQATGFKQRAVTLLQSLQQEKQRMLPAMLDLVNAPSVELTDEQWQLLTDLVLVVRYAAAHLKVVFQQHKTVDFSEVALAALTTLGHPDQPTDTALALDERIQHILVDEFQDTSFIQVDLLEQLTSGWAPDDGRSLFLVGDPMQSIYAFRKADVGLFLRLWHQRMLGHITLHRLQLSMNFRSSPAVLDWVNQACARIFPAADDIRSGAVSYAESHAGKEQRGTDSAEVHVFAAGGNADMAAAAEAQWIAEKIAQTDPALSIAILVKGKAHIVPVAAALRKKHIAFQAVDIEKLTDSQIILDLLSVYRAYVSPGDKVAWYALLRGPWCGLTLAELQNFAAVDAQPWPGLEKILQSDAVVDSDTRSRLLHVHDAFARAYQQRHQQPFAEALRELVLQLGVAATARSVAEVEAIELFFSMLGSVSDVGGVPEPDAIANQLRKLFVPAAATAEQGPVVQIMTMHKSKGLEFDVVFLPQLHRTGHADDKPLILVDKQTQCLDSNQELYLAPLPYNTDKNGASVYNFLWQLKQQRSGHEAVRLLYVACTRARRQLFMSGCLKQDDQQLRRPSSGSLLGLVWPVVESHCEQHLIDAEVPADNPPVFRRPLQGFHAVTALTSPPSVRPRLPEDEAAVMSPESDHHRRHAGILVHRLFENWVRFPALIPTAVDDLCPQWRQILHGMGVESDRLEDAVSIVQRAVKTVTANTERLEWLFLAPRQDSRAEYKITVRTPDQLQHLVIDRTFVQDGTRYIIDYKLSEPVGDLPAFLQAEKLHYQPQLQAYRQALAGQEARSSRAFLYFPLIDHLLEIEN